VIVISDTSPINYLVLIGKEELLERLFKRVVIPSAVLRELEAAAAPRDVRVWILHRPPWVEVRQIVAPPDLSLSHLDDGEREAIQLAQELAADLLLLDERAAREEALSRKLPVIGTLGILERAAESDLLDFPTALRELKTLGFFVSSALEQDFLLRDAQRKAKSH
jgi:predicted nucleic acid-binding protein